MSERRYINQRTGEVVCPMKIDAAVPATVRMGRHIG